MFGYGVFVSVGEGSIDVAVRGGVSVGINVNVKVGITDGVGVSGKVGVRVGVSAETSAFADNRAPVPRVTTS